MSTEEEQTKPTEFDMIKEKKPDLSAKTLTNYRNIYKRLREIFKKKKENKFNYSIYYHLSMPVSIK